MANESLVLPIKRGEDVEWIVTYTDANGDPVDLTGMTIEANIKRTHSDPVPLAAMVGTVLDQNTYPGKFSLGITSAVSLTLPVDQATDYSKQPKLYPCDVFTINGPIRECVIPAFIKVVPSTA
jgi:hypothetical protein